MFAADGVICTAPSTGMTTWSITMLGEHRDMAAAQAFFRSARSTTGMVPDRVTTDGHGSYPRAIRSTLGRRVEHRNSA
ncbi:DDE-type integrase/transposase/recombinase [Roseomonas sp. NAR14]|uniref:DDE-type integrase/transposase/recombinase n=2 Tax=Roseomonas acroporae TaxID=2937791 RepID=A0A9X1YDI0_9PROT|nr:DDE-type integrase/transposase/recombinase [Roseomonas acroporae]MCK8788151.1 DDE-type integrase/transposase/recombinase [Roseomonas acroporae]